MPEALRNFIQEYTPLPEEDWEIIRQEFKHQIFRKNQVILEEGKICRHFYFMEEGLIRFFCLIDGEDVTKTFGLGPFCFTSKVSFRTQSPAKEGIQALDKTVVWSIDHAGYMKLEIIPSWNLFMRKLLNEIQEFTESRLLESRIFTAEKNYENLLDRYPADLLNKIPLKHLASFLGIAPQSLSRIRNHLHHKRKS